MSDDWNTARRILCVRLDSLGDVLMTSPALQALKGSGTERELTLLTSRAGAEVAALLPMVDHTFVHEAAWMKATQASADSDRDCQLIEQLRQGHYDAAVIFTVFSQNPLPAAYLCWLAGIPLRLAHCRENPYQLLSHWISETDSPQGEIRHEVRRQLDLVATIGATTDDERLRLTIPPPARRRAHALLVDSGIDQSWPWIVVHPGASAASRRYPPELMAHALQRLTDERQFQVVFTGSADERPLIDSIRDEIEKPTASLAGQLALSELAAIVHAAPLLLTNNTGPAHVAAAVGTPVVDLYALTNPQHTPWLVPQRVLSHDVPCKYCFKSVCPEGHHLCLRGVEPQQVVAAVWDLFQESRRMELDTNGCRRDQPGEFDYVYLGD